MGRYKWVHPTPMPLKFSEINTQPAAIFEAWDVYLFTQHPSAHWCPGWWRFQIFFLMFIPKLGVSWSNLTSIFFRWVGSTSIHSLNVPGVNKVPCIQGLFDVTKHTFHQAHPQDPGPLAGAFVKSDLTNPLPLFTRLFTSWKCNISDAFFKQTNPSNAKNIIQNIQKLLFSCSRRVVDQPPNFLNFGCDNDMTYTIEPSSIAFTAFNRMTRSWMVGRLWQHNVPQRRVIFWYDACNSRWWFERFFHFHPEIWGKGFQFD